MLDLNTRILTVLTETKDALDQLRAGNRGGEVMGACSSALDKVSALIDVLDDRHNSTFKMDAHELLEHVVASHPGLLIEDSNGEAIEVNGGDLVETLCIRLNQLHSKDLSDLVKWAEENAPECEEEEV